MKDLPKAMQEQACTISKTGSDVFIYCENGDDANDVFDWLVELADEEGIELEGVGMKYADAWEELKKKVEELADADWSDGVNPYFAVLYEIDRLEGKYE